MGKSWGDDLQREHAVAAHDDEALETHELYDQDLEPIGNDLAILPSHCGLCGYKFEKPPWRAADGSLCPICGAVTAVAR